MLKFISRRLKETVDGTCCLVDSAKAWVCSLTQQQIPCADYNTKTTNLGENVENFYENVFQGSHSKFKETFCKHITSPRCFSLSEPCKKFSGESSSSGSSSSNSGKGNGKKFHEAEQLHGDLLGALRWSGAIMCGWYATQVLCMQRRKYGWDNASHNPYIKYLQISTRAVHSNVIDSYLVRATPIIRPEVVEIPKRKRTSSISSQLTEEESIFEDFYLKNLEDLSFGSKISNIDVVDAPKIELIGNPSSSSLTESNKSDSSNSSSSSRQSVTEAVNDLISYLGEIENNMAMDYIEIGDYRNAIIHLQLATNHHHPGGIFNLGVCYEKGLGVKKSLRRAMKCYQVASGLGHATAMFNLGVFYAQGLGGLKQDRKAAVKCIKTAAKLGQPDAISFLNYNNNESDNSSDEISSQDSIDLKN